MFSVGRHGVCDIDRQASKCVKVCQLVLGLLIDKCLCSRFSGDPHVQLYKN